MKDCRVDRFLWIYTELLHKPILTKYNKLTNPLLQFMHDS